MVNHNTRELYLQSQVGVFTCTFTTVEDGTVLYNGYANGIPMIADVSIDEDRFIQMWKQLLDKGYRVKR